MTAPSAIPPAVAAALVPHPSDVRTVRLAKLAGLSLIGRCAPVTRTSLPAEARAIDCDDRPGRRGISESSIDKNDGVRAAYRAARRCNPRPGPRRTGAVDAHIMRMTAWGIAQALVLARLATAEHEASLARVLVRLGRPFDLDKIKQLLSEREGLAANRGIADAPAAAGQRRRVPARSRKAVVKALGRRSPGDALPDPKSVATAAGVSRSTAARILRSIRTEEAAKAGDVSAVVPPPSLARQPKRVLARALHVERALVRALFDAIGDATAARRLEEERAMGARRKAPPPGGAKPQSS